MWAQVQQRLARPGRAALVRLHLRTRDTALEASCQPRLPGPGSCAARLAALSRLKLEAAWRRLASATLAGVRRSTGTRSSASGHGEAACSTVPG